MYVQRNNDKSSCNHCCSGKTISITYSECVFVVFVQHAKRRRCVAICGPSGCTVQYHVPPHYLINGTIFGGGERLLNIKCVLISSTNFISKTLIWRRTQRGTIIILRSRVRFPMVSLRNFNPSGRTMALGSTQTLSEMSTRNIPKGVKAAGSSG